MSRPPERVSVAGETRVKYRKPPAYLGIVLAGLAACSARDPQTAKPPGSTQLNSAESIKIRRQLAQIAGQANQAAPAEVDPDTRLDGASAGPGLTLTSRYTLVNSESQGINRTTFATKLTAVVENATCKNPDLRPLIDQGVVVVLQYRGNDGNPLGVISINRDTCAAIQ